MLGVVFFGFHPPITQPEQLTATSFLLHGSAQFCLPLDVVVRAHDWTKASQPASYPREPSRSRVRCGCTECCMTRAPSRAPPKPLSAALIRGLVLPTSRSSCTPNGHLHARDDEFAWLQAPLPRAASIFATLTVLTVTTRPRQAMQWPRCRSSKSLPQAGTPRPTGILAGHRVGYQGSQRAWVAQCVLWRRGQAKLVLRPMG